MDWGRKQFADSNVGKIQLVSFDQCNNTGTIDMKMGTSAFQEKSSFKVLGLTFSSELDWGSYNIFINKTASKKLKPFYEVISLKVTLYLYISTIQPCMK